jgi:sugar phosphate isomerase/epimerase
VIAGPLELGLYTDSLKHLGFEAALDVAARVGATGIEIATGGQSSAPHLQIDGCSRMPRRVRRSSTRSSGAPAHRRAQLLGVATPSRGGRPARGAHPLDVRLAAELGVRKLVTMSGNPGDGRTGRPSAHVVPMAGRLDGAPGAPVGRGGRAVADLAAERRQPASSGWPSSSIRSISSTTSRRSGGCAMRSDRSSG